MLADEILPPPLARDNPDVQFAPFRSFVHPSFWFKLSELKLEVDKLDESEKRIYGRYTYRNDIDTVFEVDGTSFNKYPESDLHYITVKGTLINKNTLEDLHSLETQQLMNDVGLKIWERLTTHEWITQPDTLNEFYLVTHANLKKFHYHYWFGFPAPVEPSYQMRESGHLGQYFNETEIEDIAKGYKALDKNQKSFFVILRNDGKPIVSTLKEYFDAHDDSNLNFNDVHFSFSDPAQCLVPGWPLRVFLAALGDYIKLGNLYGKTLKIIGIKCKPNYSDFQHSSLYNVKIVKDTAPTDPGSWAGWERNENKKYSPRFADMSLSMDPKHLADEGADLNIKLMKWRLAPELDLDSMKFTKCLLLGAGTLGCHVARGLLAWGFRNITFVDNGKVSYSNPTRQVLFYHADCLGGGQPKAAAAAKNLKHILPSVNSAGVSLHIPMPGHPVGASLRAETATNVATLQRLVADHDVVFLLLDTREARWLPTLLAAAGGKLAITAALGFDSYLVMRHGQGPSDGGWAMEGTAPAGTLSGRNLGCYFCNDVTAPGNSMKDRTLDQQCTVTRPGVAAVAGALAAEMLAGILQHPLRGEAPAIISEVPDTEGVTGVLGPVPHSIRGFLHNYQQVQPTCQKFPQCVGCSQTVIQKYKEEGDEFIFNVLNSGTYLEEVTGLKALHLAAEMSDVVTLDDDDDETA